MAPTQNGRADESTATPQQRQSERFSSTDDGIVIFRSSDNVLFNIHRANLRAVTDGPFAEDFVSSATDVADLTEKSDILEIIFQFVYPGNLPLLEDASRDLLFSVAEAAEKYRVAPAMALCHLNIKRDIVYSCTLRKMVYAYKHGYTEFMDAIAENSLEESPKDALSAFGPGALFIGWVLYKDAWAEILRASHKWRDLNNHGLPGVKCEDLCPL
ncbi:hypothetical protein K525DRAFT_270899 [Schizophyllum commune Loenen D]|nr:hypothetical protein K525DRAFT_270899 [Schizophyllum commune Loenen D]